MINVLDRAFENPLEKEEHATTLLAGGIVQLGYQCGLVWGAAMGAGARAFQLLGSGPQAETGAIIATRRIVESFRDRNGDIDCYGITGIDWKKPTDVVKTMLTGGPIRCLNLAARNIPPVYDEIDATLSEEGIEAPSPPVSCTSMLAEKMGASDLQQVMAAGLAGGIGLCGGACGALGAAIWMNTIDSIEDGEKIKYKNPKAKAVIARFREITDDTFPCSEIVGRKFESVDDHAGYLREGGCSELIEALATAAPAE
ncbi:C-GCAxxG-C-C family (seleno)protein [Gemmatimonadota bacterium]